MNSQELRDLSEAYMSVYQLDEISPELVLAASKAAGKKGKPAQASRLYKKFAARDQAANYAKYQRSSVKKEETDLYDIILSHLLDEGYAETQEQAEVIMVNMSEDWREDIVEKTAMAKHGYDEAPIRNAIAKKTGGGSFADKATALENQPTYGDTEKEKQRQNLARKQRGDFRDTTSSNPGLHGYGHQSNDPAVNALQAARGAQRGALTPNEKKKLGR
jgi:hypothetical protein